MTSGTIKKCVVLARGLGSRMRKQDAGVRLSASQSSAASAGLKAMIPVGRPFLDYVLSGLADAGFEQVCLVIGPEHDMVRDYYTRVQQPTRIQITFALQAKAIGTANALLAAEEFAGADGFLTINADNYYPVEVLRALQGLGQPGTVLFEEEALVRESNIPAQRIRDFAYAAINGDGFLSDLIEKPDADTVAKFTGQALVSMNCWRFDPAIFPVCREVPVSPRGEFELPNAVRLAIQKGMKFKAAISRAGVLDLSRRSDIAAVAERLKDVQGATMTPSVAESLVSTGMTEAEAQQKARLFETLEGPLPSVDGAERMRWFVPGRIEVLGKHTDYAGGRSLLCTAERGFCVAAIPRPDSVVRINDVVRQKSFEFTISPDLTIPDSGWTVYPTTVARRVARNFPGNLRGADISLASDLPRAAGMSSSSALVVAIFSVIAAVNRLSEHSAYTANIHDTEDLAGYLGCIENGQTYKSLLGDSGVGTFGGSEDHTAILGSQPGHLKQYAFCPVRWERTLAVPANCTFVIAVSGVVADKTGSARAQYNRASEAVKAILDIWRSVSGSNDQTLAAALAGTGDCPDRLRSALARSRFRRPRIRMAFESVRAVLAGVRGDYPQSVRRACAAGSQYLWRTGRRNHKPRRRRFSATRSQKQYGWHVRPARSEPMQRQPLAQASAAVSGLSWQGMKPRSSRFAGGRHTNAVSLRPHGTASSSLLPLDHLWFVCNSLRPEQASPGTKSRAL